MKKKTATCLILARIICPGILLSLLCFACNPPAENISEKNTPTVEGVWKLTDHFVVNEFGDTVWVYPESAQYKIYLDGHVMWSGDPDEDSVEWYGFGTYELGGDTLKERLTTMSYSMQEAMGSDEEAILVVEFDENNFRQYIEWTWQDTVYHNTEVYIKLK